MNKRVACVVTALAIIAVWAGATLATLPPNKCTGESCPYQQTKAYFIAFSYPARLIFGFLESHDAFFVAVGTGFIAVFTFTLWRSTNKMWEAGEKQIAIAREAANAAASANLIAKEAFLLSERPYLLLQITNVDNIRLAIQGPPRIEYSLLNCGKSPAILKYISIEVLDSEGPTPYVKPPPKNYTPMYHLVPVGGIYGPHAVNVSGDRPLQGYMHELARRIVVQGHFRYADVRDALTEEWFCLRGTYDIQGFTAEGGVHRNYRDTRYPQAIQITIGEPPKKS